MVKYPFRKYKNAKRSVNGTVTMVTVKKVMIIGTAPQIQENLPLNRRYINDEDLSQYILFFCL